jgi:hypothetical protein
MIILSFNLCSFVSRNGFIKQSLALSFPLVCSFPIFVLIFQMHLLVKFVNVVGSCLVPFCVGALVWLSEGAVESIVSLMDLLGVCCHASVSVLEISFSLLQAHLFVLVLLLVLFHFFDHALGDLVLLLFHMLVLLVSLDVSLLVLTYLLHGLAVSEAGLHRVVVFHHRQVVVSDMLQGLVLVFTVQLSSEFHVLVPSFGIVSL